MAQKETATAATPTAAPKYTIEKLRQNCLKLFGVTTSTFNGATYGLRGEYTVEEIKKAIDTWQKKPVKTGKKEEVK